MSGSSAGEQTIRTDLWKRLRMLIFFTVWDRLLTFSWYAILSREVNFSLDIDGGRSSFCIPTNCTLDHSTWYSIDVRHFLSVLACIFVYTATVYAVSLLAM